MLRNALKVIAISFSYSPRDNKLSPNPKHQTKNKVSMLSMSSDEEEYSEIATPDLINYDEKKMVTDKYGSISLCKFVSNLEPNCIFCTSYI